MTRYTIGASWETAVYGTYSTVLACDTPPKSCTRLPLSRLYDNTWQLLRSFSTSMTDCRAVDAGKTIPQKGVSMLGYLAEEKKA
ncbi:unnamed protein product [Macrosiphum euphorbiae]|uniref:Uncharacterized protein n=1 Tax=Macrosiphum euphorbiae TaxID=13131 RepID=A0AAV0VM62_9HEMI|nr:unnamed protein product [Macrosiphum euphorbiae]